MGNSSIEWTEKTWNPVAGCDKVSQGCRFCYAEGIAKRYSGTKAFPDGFAVTLHPDCYYKSDQNPSLHRPMPTVPTKDRFGLVLVYINGEPWVITDIGMRMLTPRELFRAQGFPDSYVIDPLYRGKPLSKTAQIRCCGNSVCSQIAEALVALNVVLESDEIVTDAFAGGGGASEGMKRGLNAPAEHFARQFNVFTPDPWFSNVGEQGLLEGVC